MSIRLYVCLAQLPNDLTEHRLTAAEQFLNQAIPMKGRMIHHDDERQESQIYDPKQGQCINSISRPILNQRLLEALPDSIKTRFNTKLARVDFKKRVAWGQSTAQDVRPGQEAGLQADTKAETQDSDGTPFDLIIGCDGSWSKVRSELMRVER